MLNTHARLLRRGMTDAEKRLWGALRARQLGGHKFRRQHPFERYILDFACVERLVAVEADGGQHGARDDTRDAVLTRHGWRVLRFWNNDILENLDGVLLTILAALK